MTPSPSLVHRMGVRYKRLHHARLNKGKNGPWVPPTHEEFAKVIACAEFLFPTGDFRWLMRSNDDAFFDDVCLLLDGIDTKQSTYLFVNLTPRFVLRSCEEAQRAARKGGVR